MAATRPVLDTHPVNARDADTRCVGSVGLDPAWLEQIQRYLPTPLITVMLDISPETAMKRKRKDRDRYERDTELLRRVRDSYKRQAAQHGWVVIDGEKSKDEVSEAVEKAVLSRLEPVSARARS